MPSGPTMQLFLLGALGPRLVDRLGVSETELGLTTTVGSGTAVVLSPVGGRIVDRAGPRRSLVALLVPAIESPTYTTARYGEASVVVATVEEDRSALFLVDRDLSQPAQVAVDVRSLGSSRILEALTLADQDVYAKNTLAEPHRVVPCGRFGVI